MTKSVHLQRLENRVTRTAARLVEHAEQRRLTAAELASTKLPWYAVRNLADPDQPADVFVFDEIGRHGQDGHVPGPAVQQHRRPVPDARRR
jgi:hypothetical protein